MLRAPRHLNPALYRDGLFRNRFHCCSLPMEDVISSYGSVLKKSYASPMGLMCDVTAHHTRLWHNRARNISSDATEIKRIFFTGLVAVDRPVATGRHSGTFPANFVVPRKKYFKHKKKRKSCPRKVYILPPKA